MEKIFKKNNNVEKEMDAKKVQKLQLIHPLQIVTDPCAQTGPYCPPLLNSGIFFSSLNLLKITSDVVDGLYCHDFQSIWLKRQKYRTQGGGSPGRFRHKDQ